MSPESLTVNLLDQAGSHKAPRVNGVIHRGEHNVDTRVSVRSP